MNNKSLSDDNICIYIAFSLGAAIWEQLHFAVANASPQRQSSADASLINVAVLTVVRKQIYDSVYSRT